jgi:hypothetical protein
MVIALMAEKLIPAIRSPLVSSWRFTVTQPMANRIHAAAVALICVKKLKGACHLRCTNAPFHGTCTRRHWLDDMPPIYLSIYLS